MVFVKDDEIPFDEILRRRLYFAKFIGLALFSANNSDGWDGTMLAKDRKQTYESAYRTLFNLIDISQPAAQQIALSMATQLFILWPQSPVFMEALGNASFQRHLDHLLMGLRDAWRTSQGNLQERYPFGPFSQTLCNFLRNLYDELEAPLAIKFCGQALGDDEKFGDESQEIEPKDQHIRHKRVDIPEKKPDQHQEMEPMTQINFMTQPPQVLLPSSPNKSAATKTISPPSKNKKSAIMTRESPSSVNVIVNQPDSTQLSTRAPSSNSGPNASKSAPLPSSDSDSSISLYLEDESLSSSSITKTSKKRKHPLQDQAKIEKNAPLTKLKSSLTLVAPEVFRGHLCRDDNVLASIVEKTNPIVQKYLQGRVEKKSSSRLSKSLLERHDSAEAIEWSQPTPRLSIEEPTTPHKQSKTTKTRKQRQPWSKEEFDCLVQGYKRFGNKWGEILAAFPQQLGKRTKIHLKYKIRHLESKGLLD